MSEISSKDKFDEFLKKHVIVKLEDAERQAYCSFIEYTWNDNIKACRFNLSKFPRWAIIAGYYAMHDLAKLFLAKRFNLKMASRVHFATIVALENVLENERMKKDIINLLDKAESYYAETELSRHLRIAKREREKVQYYTGRQMDFKNYQKKASYFLDNIVNPFAKILLELIK